MAMTLVPDLIAQWRERKIAGLALMRGLVTYRGWQVPVSEAAIAMALADHVLPSLSLSTTRDGDTCLLLFSSGEALGLYSTANAASGTQHLVTLPGRTLFDQPFDAVDRIWIDAFSPCDIFYGREHFGRLRGFVRALAVEEALTGLRHGTAAPGALGLVRDYDGYTVPVTLRDGKPSFVPAPDAEGRSLAAVFTADDAFDAFIPDAKVFAGGNEVQQVQMTGAALFDTLRRLPIDGFVFNCAGPGAPAAFARAVAGIVLDEA